MVSQDNPKRLSGYALWINVLLKLGFIWTTFFSPGSCQDALILECPAVFRNGENLIYCTVNTTAVTEAGCTGIGAVIGFQITLPGQSPLTTCDADLNNCVSTFNSDGCRCVLHTSDLKRYELNFTGDSSVHTNGSFDCIISCLPGSPPPTVKDPSCDPIDFTSPTTPTTPPGQGPDWLWLLLLLPLLLIPLLIVIIIFCCLCGNIACHWCCCTGRCYCRCADKAEAGGGSAWCRKEDSFITHVCYLCGYKVNEEKKEFICYSLKKGKVVVTTRSGQRDNKVDADHVATNGSGQRDNKVDADHVATNGARNGERVSKPVQETELTEVRETSSPPSGEEETSPNGTS